MKISLQDKVAIVTGASRGIGRAIAESLAGAGAAVVVNHRASERQAGEVVAAIEKSGGRAVAVQADMGVVAEARRLIDRTVEIFGGLDILVNNAGVGNRTAMADMTEKEFDWTMSVNARGPMFAIQAATPRMRDGGRIVNISSCGTHIAQVTGSAGGVSDVERRAGAAGALLRQGTWRAWHHDQQRTAGVRRDRVGQRYS